MNRLAVLLLVAAPLALAEDDWKEVQDADGVKVYSRSLPNRAIKSVKGTGIVDAPVMKIARSPTSRRLRRSPSSLAASISSGAAAPRAPSRHGTPPSCAAQLATAL